MRIYVAGPMRGVPDFNFPLFNKTTERLRAAGHTVFNPAERDIVKHGGDMFKTQTATEEEITKKGFSLRDALKADTSWICENADAICLLPNWEESVGAKAEVALAHALKIWVLPVEDLLEVG